MSFGPRPVVFPQLVQAFLFVVPFLCLLQVFFPIRITIFSLVFSLYRSYHFTSYYLMLIYAPGVSIHMLFIALLTVDIQTIFTLADVAFFMAFTTFHFYITLSNVNNLTIFTSNIKMIITSWAFHL